MNGRQVVRSATMAAPQTLNEAVWRQVLDRAVHAGLLTELDPQQLMVHLRTSGLTADEQEIAEGEPTTSGRMTRLVSLIQWRPSLLQSFREGVRRQSVEVAQVVDRAVDEALGAPRDRPPPQSGPSEPTQDNVTRWRLALRMVEGEVDALERWAIPGLYTAECLSGRECDDVRERRARLVDTLVTKQAPALARLRAFLRDSHADLFSSLLAAYHRVSVERSNPYAHGVPSRPLHFVPRPLFSDRVRAWMRGADPCHPPRLLLLSGMASIGKSSLAADAAYESFQHGFHRAVWLRAGEDEVAGSLRTLVRRIGGRADVDASLGDLSTAVAERAAELCRHGDRLLLVIDDLRRDDLLPAVECFGSVVVTSRDADIGRRSCFSVTRVEVGEGMTEAERDKLLERVMGSEAFSRLKRHESWATATELLERFHRFPLTTNIVGSLLSREEEQWRDRGAEYFGDLSEDLLSAEPARGRPRERSALSGSDYVYGDVHCAIRASFDRLPKERQEQYRMLAMFERGDDIRPVTMATVWGAGDASMNRKRAQTDLDLFTSFHVLERVRYDEDAKEAVYQLHDLQFDVLASLAAGKRSAIRRAAVRSYQGRLPDVAQADSFFYTDFVRWCLETKEVDLAVRCLCRLSYTLTRVRLGGVGGFLREFEEAVNCSADEELCGYFAVVVSSISAAVARGDPDVVLRAALLRSHDERVYRDAHAIVCGEGRGGQFLEFVTSPRREVTRRLPLRCQLEIGREHVGAGASMTSADVDAGEQRVLVGYDDGTVCLYDWSRMEALSVTRLPSRVVLVQFAGHQGALCLAVAESGCSLIDARGGAGPRTAATDRATARRLSLPGLADSGDGGALAIRDARLVAGHLWLLVGRRRCEVLCYEAPLGADVRLVRAFGCDEGCDRLSVHSSGTIAAASGRETRGGVFDIRAAESRPLPVDGRAVGFVSDSNSLLMVGSGQPQMTFKNVFGVFLAVADVLIFLIAQLILDSALDPELRSLNLDVSLLTLLWLLVYYKYQNLQQTTFSCKLTLGVCRLWLSALAVLMFTFFLAVKFSSLWLFCRLLLLTLLASHVTLWLTHTERVRVISFRTAFHLCVVCSSVHGIGLAAVLWLSDPSALSALEVVSLVLLLLAWIIIGARPQTERLILVVSILTVVLCRSMTFQPRLQFIGVSPGRMIAHSTLLHIFSWKIILLFLSKFLTKGRRHTALCIILACDSALHVWCLYGLWACGAVGGACAGSTSDSASEGGALGHQDGRSASSAVSTFLRFYSVDSRIFGFLTFAAASIVVLSLNALWYVSSRSDRQIRVTKVLCTDVAELAHEARETPTPVRPEDVESLLHQNFLIQVYNSSLFFWDVDDDRLPRTKFGCAKDHGDSCRSLVCRDFLLVSGAGSGSSISVYSLRGLRRPELSSASVPNDDLGERQPPTLRRHILSVHWVRQLADFVVAYYHKLDVNDLLPEELPTDRFALKQLSNQEVIGRVSNVFGSELTAVTGQDCVAVVDGAGATVTQFGVARAIRGLTVSVRLRAGDRITAACYVEGDAQLLASVTTAGGRSRLVRLADRRWTDLAPLPGPASWLRASAETDSVVCLCTCAPGTRAGELSIGIMKEGRLCGPRAGELSLRGLEDGAVRLQERRAAAFEMSGDGRRLAVLDRTGTLAIWDVATKTAIFRRGQREDVARPVRFAFSAADHRLLLMVSALGGPACVISEGPDGHDEQALSPLPALADARSLHWPGPARVVYFSPSGGGGISGLHLDSGTLTSLFDAALTQCSPGVALSAVGGPKGPVFVLSDSMGQLHRLRHVSRDEAAAT